LKKILNKGPILTNPTSSAGTDASPFPFLVQVRGTITRNHRRKTNTLFSKTTIHPSGKRGKKSWGAFLPPDLIVSDLPSQKMNEGRKSSLAESPRPRAKEKSQKKKKTQREQMELPPQGHSCRAPSIKLGKSRTLGKLLLVRNIMKRSTGYCRGEEEDEGDSSVPKDTEEKGTGRRLGRRRSRKNVPEKTGPYCREKQPSCVQYREGITRRGWGETQTSRSFSNHDTQGSTTR